VPRAELDLEPVQVALRAGLDRVDGMAPGTGYALVTGGLRGIGPDFAAMVRGELGARVGTRVSVFGYGEADFALHQPPAWQAGLGARVTW
jgi:hypothetical protein